MTDVHITAADYLRHPYFYWFLPQIARLCAGGQI